MAEAINSSLKLFLIPFQSWINWLIVTEENNNDSTLLVYEVFECVLTMCRWAWRWITNRRCCWWVKPRTSAPARPWRRTETPALRLSTWWVPGFPLINKSTLLVFRCILPSACFCVVVWYSMSASTASITLRPSIRRWARRGPSCSHRFLEKPPTRWRAAAWKSVCVRVASIMAACPPPPSPLHCEWCSMKSLPFNAHDLINAWNKI